MKLKPAGSIISRSLAAATLSVSMAAVIIWTWNVATYNPTTTEAAEDYSPPPAAMSDQAREDAGVQLMVEFLNAVHTNWIITVQRRTNQ